MKRFFATFLTVLFLSSFTIANAVNIEKDISVTNYVFDGKGKITSFDIDPEGNILICVNQAYSHNRYVMIFQPDRELIQTFEFRFRYAVYAGFTGEGNIVLYGARSSKATVFDRQGKILYEYSENINQEKAELSMKGTQYYGNISYEINLGGTLIKKYSGENAENFYEVADSTPEFMVFWCCIMLFIVGASISLRAKLKKGLKQYKENESFPQEE